MLGEMVHRAHENENASGGPPSAATPPATPLATPLVTVTIATLQAEPVPVLDCGVFLSAWRHGTRAVVVFDMGTFQKALQTPPGTGVWETSLERLLRYYRTVPRKAATKNGVVLLLCGSPKSMPVGFSLIDNAVKIHYRQVDHRD